MSTAPPAANAAAAPAQPAEGLTGPVEGGPGEDAQLDSFPPYPPYAAPAPPSVADAVIAGHGLRRQHKAVLKKSVRPPPRPARPKFPKATDVKMSRKEMRAHAYCLRRHGAILTDRLEYMSKPRRRNIISFWREKASTLPADTIARLRSMLDADEPFKPDQAYEYFVNLRKTRNKQIALERARVRELKKEINSLCSGKKFTWARNATVAFARGVQQRLSKPGRYVLSDGMLRLSNIILSDICGFMKMRRIPSRNNPGSKANFMMEVSDKVAVWIDEILSESDDRMLMMDFDEDEDVALEARGGSLFGGGDDGGGSGGVYGIGVRGKIPENPAYLKLDGNMREAFDIITQEMDKKGDENLISYGKFEQSYHQGADELRHANDLNPTNFSVKLGEEIWSNLSDLTKDKTPPAVAPAMGDMLEICANVLAQNAEDKKIKGPLYKLLIQEMRKQPNVTMYQRGKIRRTNAEAAKELESGKALQDTDHPDPALAESIFANMKRLVNASTPEKMKKEMDETLEFCSNYLSQKAVDDSERGPAFDLLIKELETQGDKPFCDTPALGTTNAVAYVLKSAPGLKAVVPEPTEAEEFAVKLHKAVDKVTPTKLKSDMKDTIDLCSDYLSAYRRDRVPALKLLLETMDKFPKNVIVERDGYALDNQTGASEIENAPVLVPYLPIKDIAAEIKENLTTQMTDVTPDNLKHAMQALISDVSKHLSQIVALRSGAAGDRYKMDFLAKIKNAFGSRPLYKYKAHGKTYAEAAGDLSNAEPTKITDLPKETVDLGKKIHMEMDRGIPTKLPPSIMTDMASTMDLAAMHLAKVGAEKGDAIEYVVNLMKEKDIEPLANLQGYDQTYGDGARRIEQTPTLKAEEVDIGAATTVKKKLTELTQENVDEKYEKVLPKVIEDTANFLAAPIPETPSEKKKVLGDLMSREGDKVIAQKGAYKQTYQGAGADIMDSPEGETKAKDEEMRKEIVKQIEEVIPDKKMEMILKDTKDEGAAYLTDAVTGRAQALEVIEKSLKQEGVKEFINVGKFNKDHAQVAEMVTTAPNLKSEDPSPIIMTNVEHTFDILPKEVSADKPLAQQHLQSMTNIAAKYVATKATEESGLDATQLAELDAQGFNDAAKAAAEQRRLAALAATIGEEYDPTSPPGETREQRKQRLAEAAEAERRALAAAAKAKAAEDGGQASSLGPDFDDPEHMAALGILQEQLQAHGTEVLYEQSPSTLTHQTASQWLSNPNPMEVNSTVKNSPDTGRLQKKFERKFSGIVKEKTPENLRDPMQDVVIESSRKTAEYFVTENYKSIVDDGLVAAMQMRGKEVLVNVDGAAETNFFAAQRLKKKDPLAKPENINYKVASETEKILTDVVRSRPMPRKVSKTMKEHIKEASEYLSAVATKPDDYIETYVALLDQLDIADDLPLIEGDVPKTCKESANYLRKLNTFKDTIGLPNQPMQQTIQQKLKIVMFHTPPAKTPTPAVLDTVTADVAGLLVSFVRRQGEKDGALKVLVREMDEAGEGPVLRHGVIRKTFKEAADQLRGKTTDQFDVPNPDPVVSRKLQIKLTNLMQDKTPPNFQTLMPGVINDATNYLAVHILEPQVIKVCKCFKHVFVQCELWCEEILRRVSHPCCRCERHVSVQALQDLVPGDFLQVHEDQTHVLAPGVEISLKPCPKQARTYGKKTKSATTAYFLHSTTHKKFGYIDSRKPSPSSTRYNFGSQHPSTHTHSQHSSTHTHHHITHTLAQTPSSSDSTLWPSYLKTLPLEMHTDKTQFIRRQQEKLQSFEARNQNRLLEDMSPPSYSPATRSYNNRIITPTTIQSREPAQQFLKPVSDTCSIAPSKSEYSSRTPIITSEHNAIDWDSAMVNLLWNVMSWRDWIQEIVDDALTSQSFSRGDTADSWLSFYRRVTLEALQWHQYNVSSRQLTTSLLLRYTDKEIAAPVVSNVKTKTYLEYLKAMLEIIEMLNSWTQWLALVVKETHSLQQIHDSKLSLDEMRWYLLKKKVDGHFKDWENYLKFLKVSWEQKYKAVIADYMPSLEKRGPVWVMSAGGAVPSGAVAAGVYDNEVIWVARTIHRCTILPATLLPSNHCCLVYADGQVHSYSKYQVMCNAEVHWVPWRGGSMHKRAVSVAPGTRVGRVHYHDSHLLGTVKGPEYHCCVVIFDRPFAFNCYELLVLVSDDSQ